MRKKITSLHLNLIVVFVKTQTTFKFNKALRSNRSMLICIETVELKIGLTSNMKGQSIIIILTWNKFNECQYLTKRLKRNIS